VSEYGVPTQGQLDKINALAKRPLDKSEVFVFSTKMIGDALIRERYTKLDKSLLEVYRNDARTGVAFMLDHAWAGIQKALVYGRTFDAVLRRSNEVEGEKWGLYGDVYIVRGKEKDGISTDSIIADIEDGTLFDVSIGFVYSTQICSICGNEYFGGECSHFRGREYDGQLCYVIAKPPGYLMELSGVFDGAYPTAGMLSATGDFEDSLFIQVPDEELKKLPSGIMTYATYGSASGRLATFHKKDDLVKGNIFSVPDLSQLKGGGNQVSEEVKTYTQEQVDALVKEEVDKAVAEALAKQTEDHQVTDESVQAFMSAEQVKEALGQEVPADKVLTYAKEGVGYRNELKEEALKAGVRAMGDAFKKETWERNFDLMDIQGIKDTMATWQAQAEAEIPAGRQTQAGLGREQKLAMPAEAFKVGRK
jgi:hypothetical protein